MINGTILGTACMVPTKDRNASAIYLEIKGKGILFDCGEGTQRQMNIAGIQRTKVRYIFISHWHADHTAGILGLIQTIGSSTDDPELDIFGPTGTKNLFRNLMNACVFENKMNIKVHEFNCPTEKKLLKTSEFEVFAINLDHSTHCLGFKLRETDKRKLKLKQVEEIGLPEGPIRAELQKGKTVEFKGKKLNPDDYSTLHKGKIFTYIADTAFTRNAIDLAKDSDIILSEATHIKKHEDRSEQYKHMTSEQAAQIASMSNSKHLILTHFSQRYKTQEELLSEARDIFPNVEIAHDFLKFKI